MDARDFVTAMQEEVLNDSVEMYKKFLRLPTQELSPMWRAIAATYAQMDDEHQAAFDAMIRQIIIDTLSNVFGIIDGPTLLRKYRDNFYLEYGPERVRLNGDLQDIFLENLEAIRNTSGKH